MMWYKTSFGLLIVVSMNMEKERWGIWEGSYVSKTYDVSKNIVLMCN